MFFDPIYWVFMSKLLGQLKKIGTHTEAIALKKGPDFFPGNDETPPPPDDIPKEDDFFHYYFMLDRSLRETLTVLNADYILLDEDKNVINPFPEDYFQTSDALLKAVTNEIGLSKTLTTETYLDFHLDTTPYIAIIKPVSDKNTFGLGWIVIYSSLEQVNELQVVINLILFAILIFSALIIALFSSLAAKKISQPFSSLNQHIRLLAERNFGKKLHIPVDDELQEFVNTINLMSEKLLSYDQAQKTFLQNASHEFRTPLMSIQSYAEGIVYDVVDPKEASAIIIDETKRMTQLVEDLLYLSRLEAIEEHDHFETIDYHGFVQECLERMKGIALKSALTLDNHNLTDASLKISADVEKLSRAITNIISNCMRYAASTVKLTSQVQDQTLYLMITDDGPGFETTELPYIFERFYKGKKGHFGLGLAISKNIIEKHKGTIQAENAQSGAVFTIELPLAH